MSTAIIENTTWRKRPDEGEPFPKQVYVVQCVGTLLSRYPDLPFNEKMVVYYALGVPERQYRVRSAVEFLYYFVRVYEEGGRWVEEVTV